MPDSIALDAAHRTLFDAGMAVRREVVGDAYVDAAAQRTAGTDAETLQQYMCEIVWGSVWTRPGLDRRSRSLVNLGILVAQGHQQELAAHVRGGLRNGLTREEIVEAIVHATAYTGAPAGLSAMQVVADTLAEELGPRSTEVPA